MASDLAALGGVFSVERGRLSRHDDPPETLDVPRDKLGLLALLGGGCSLLGPGDVPSPASLSSSSIVGVRAGMERRKYCSVGRVLSGASSHCSGIAFGSVDG